MNPAKCNYAAHEKEMLAIIHALKKWQVYLEGHPFTVFTDHATLCHFHKQPHLTGHQACWSEILQSYEANIKYLPGKLNVVADAISRCPDLQVNAISAMIPPEQFSHQIKADLEQAPEFLSILRSLRGLPVDQPVPSSLLKHYSIDSE